MSNETARGVDVARLPSSRRLLFGGAAAVFWGWLLARWFHDWVVRPGVGPSSRRPFVRPSVFEAGAARLHDLAAGAGVLAGLLEWLAGGFEFAAFGAAALPALAAGAWLTVVLTVLSMLFGLVVAVPLSVARSYGGPVLRWTALAYTELVRGTPLLAQLFVLYYGLPTSNFIRELPGVGGGVIPHAAIWVAVVGFTINSSAYQSEYIRSALQSVDTGQLTAARSVGLSKLEGIRHVVLPQGLRYAIPGWTNEFVYLVKYSSLAAFIAVPELFRRGRSIGSDTFQFVDIYLWVAILYVALVLSLSVAMGWFEERVAIPGLGQAADR